MADKEEHSSTFSFISNALTNLGALPLASLTDRTFVTSFGQLGLNSSGGTSSADNGGAVSAASFDMEPHDAVKFLDGLAKSLFGQTPCLRYELESQGYQDLRKCTLTITLPNGATRSYATSPVYVRKIEARLAAAAVAVKNGAADFMRHGQSSTAPAPMAGPDLSPCRQPLPPQQVPASDDNITTGKSMGKKKKKKKKAADAGLHPRGTDTTAIDRIEAFCEERNLTLEWLTTQEHSPQVPHFGSTLKIKLDPIRYSLYVTNVQYETASQAKLACADQALSEGVIDPVSPAYGSSDPIRASHAPVNASVNHVTEDFQSPELGLTYEEYLESFSPLFKASFAALLKCKGHTGGPVGMIRKQLELAKDPQVDLSIIMIIKHLKEPGGTKHGAILRLRRYWHTPEITTFFVAPRFSKRRDAKSAVHLFALSRGIIDLMDEVAANDGTREPESIHPELVDRAKKELDSLTEDYKRAFSIDALPVDYEETPTGWTAKLGIIPHGSASWSRQTIAKYKTAEDALLVLALLATNSKIHKVLQRAFPAEQAAGSDIQMIEIRSRSPPISISSSSSGPVALASDNPDPKAKAPSTAGNLVASNHANRADPALGHRRPNSARSPPAATREVGHGTVKNRDSTIQKRPRSPSPNERTREKRARLAEPESQALRKFHGRDRSPSPSSSSTSNVDAIDSDLLRVTRVEAHQVIRSLTKLNNWCDARKVVKPILGSELIIDSRNERKRRVWLILNVHKYELPILFGSEEEGYESLSKQVLMRLKQTGV